MKISLIAPTPPDICAFGVRSLSSVLKSAGHDVKIIFLPVSHKSIDQSKWIFYYPDQIINEIVIILKDSDLIGLSLMTNYFDCSVQITQRLKKEFSVPIIWGGIHPTVRPEESLRYADIICIGEGEEALLELAVKLEAGEDIFNIKNLWFNKKGTIIKNELRPLIQDLDSLPFSDYALENHYVIDENNNLVKMTYSLYEMWLPHEPFLNRKAFRIMTSRGCPHNCSYCINPFLKSLYGHQKYLRFRSVNNVINELKLIVKQFKFKEVISLIDDTFTARRLKDIMEFSEMYRTEIGLPFSIQVSPSTLTEEKIKYLVGAGKVMVHMGIQSGSEETKKLYNRNMTNEIITNAVLILHKYTSQTYSPCYHLILDNPWEKLEDLLKTLKLIISIPRPFNFLISSLICFPGTMLAEKAKRDHIVVDEINEVYRNNFLKPRLTYINLLFLLTDRKFIPKFLLRFLSREYIVKKLNMDSLIIIYKFIFDTIKFGELSGKGFKALFKGEFKLIVRYFKNNFKKGSLR